MIADSKDRLTIIRTREPSPNFADLAQAIGFAAWQGVLRRRPDEQIRHTFNPHGLPNRSAKLLSRMRSKNGGEFVGTAAYFDGQVAGYAWAAEDLGNVSLGVQLTKRANGEEPVVWNAQLNVLPRSQGRGIGTILLRETLVPFDENRRVTADIFDENSYGLQWYRNWGFEPEPDHPSDPNKRPDGPDKYFGEGAEHALQWHFVAPSVDEVINRIERQSDIARGHHYNVVEQVF